MIGLWSFKPRRAGRPEVMLGELNHKNSSSMSTYVLTVTLHVFYELKKKGAEYWVKQSENDDGHCLLILLFLEPDTICINKFCSILLFF